ncbi:MAG: insulinase family protein [Clostridia bacterium]|jgi:predicted Zn-dependent peptidase|nr:insulinase family protein [Clostridia bacterium]
MIKTMDNGIRIVAEQLPDFNSVSVGIWVKTGSTCETPKENGVSHFIEHMMFKGTDKRNAKDIAVDMDKIGGQINAFTSKECTCYHARVVPEKLDVALDVLSDLFSNSVLDKTEMEKEKGVVLEEIAMMNDDVEDLAHEKISELFFMGSTLSQPILGPAENIKNFTRDDLVSYIDRHYYPQNVVVAIAGKFDESAMMASVEHYLGGYKRGIKTNCGSDNSGFSPKSGSLFIEKDVEQTHLCLAFPGLTAGNDERFAMAVMNNVLGGGMSSRLFQSIREEKGLAYSVYSYPSTYSYAGMFSLYGGTTAANADLVVELMKGEINTLKSDKIGEDDFTQGKDQLLGNYVLSLESTNAKMSALGKSMLLLDEEYDENDTIAKIKAVSIERVNALIDSIFDYGKMSAVFAGKIEKRKEIEDLLEG